MSQPYLAPWDPSSHLHLYNRACDNNLYFRDVQDRHVFLKKMRLKVAPYLDILSYNLIPNHWHANAQLFSGEKLERVLQQRGRLNVKQRKYLAGQCTYQEVIA